VAWYVDTSALVKLVVAEAETPALRTWLGSAERRLVSSELARAELLRAVRRVSPAHLVRARDVLAAVDLLALHSAVLEQAALLDPPSLRTLDALHLASALALGDDLEGLLAYDERLVDAARAIGLRALAPA
jgi:predicted nucleic acid-binding protein